MVRKYVRKTEMGSWSEDNNMKAAIDGIKNKSLSFSKATELYHIPRATFYGI